MNTINYRDLKALYLTDEAKANIYHTGFYSAPSWNGIVGVRSYDYSHKIPKENPVQYFEVVTQFGTIKSATPVHLPVVEVAWTT